MRSPDSNPSVLLLYLLLLFRACNRSRKPESFPPQVQHPAVAVGVFVDRDRELVHRRRERMPLHVDAGEILTRVMLRAPLAGLFVDDQLGRAVLLRLQEK